MTDSSRQCTADIDIHPGIQEEQYKTVNTGGYRGNNTKRSILGIQGEQYKTVNTGDTGGTIQNGQQFHNKFGQINYLQ